MDAGIDPGADFGDFWNKPRFCNRGLFRFWPFSEPAPVLKFVFLFPFTLDGALILPIFRENNRNYMNKPHFYHFATEGLKDDVLFSSTTEFIAGINRIAFCLIRLGIDHPVQVVCFCLMDNHVHFILYGREEDCILFMDNYKHVTELWLRHHGEDNHSGKHWNIGHWLIPDQERLRTTIAYIHRNPTAAGMALSPSGYRWSSAQLLYSDTAWIQGLGKPVSELSGKARMRLFNSRTEIPGDWIVLPDGLIWPGAFVNTSAMERQFSSVQDYQFCLNKRVEEDINQEMHATMISLPDGEIAARARRMAGKLYGEDRIRRLTVQQRTSLARVLKKETGTTAKQIARVVHLKLEEIEPILNPRRG
jgi:REP element-mobilizing transposase RayT